MEIEPIWANYVTYDEDGFINGVRDDSPEEVKKAYEAYQREKAEKAKSREPIFK